jgi:hypothetical protein
VFALFCTGAHGVCCFVSSSCRPIASLALAHFACHSQQGSRSTSAPHRKPHKPRFQPPKHLTLLLLLRPYSTFTEEAERSCKGEFLCDKMSISAQGLMYHFEQVRASHTP